MRQLVLTRDWRFDIRMPMLFAGSWVFAESEVEIEGADRFARFEVFHVMRNASQQRDVLESDRHALRINNVRRVAKEVGPHVELERLVAGVTEEDEQRDSLADAELTLRLRQSDSLL